MRVGWIKHLILFVVLVTGCGSQAFVATEQEVIMNDTGYADVLIVKATGGDDTYQFEVQVSSPDMGCDQYADWWEVISEDGHLLYRRILLHSHVGEQPFSRSGGPVPVKSDTVVYIRAHMNTNGYGGQVLRGTVKGGFNAVEIEPGFGAELEALPPLPDGCAF